MIFSKARLNALKPSRDGKRLVYHDEQVPSLAVAVLASGTKTFYVVKRVGTKMSWIKLGRFPELTVENAREMAMTVLADIVKGKNPADARRAVKGAPTFSEYFAIYGERHGSQMTTWDNNKQRFRDYIAPAIGHLKLSEIERPMLAKILTSALNQGLAVSTVRAIRALLSHMLNKAVDWGYLTASPANRLKVEGKKVERDRFLNGGELKRFFESIAQEKDPWPDFFLLALLTGARRSNLAAMHWNDIDLVERAWRIPKTKNSEPLTVVLCPEAVEILLHRKEITTGGYVFPTSRKSEHIKEPKKALMRVLERAGIPYGQKVPNGVTLHDLRRTLGSWQAKTGASLILIGRTLGHKSPQATKIYARVDRDPVEESVNTATSAMFAAAGLKGADDDMAKLPEYERAVTRTKTKQANPKASTV
jgi:integrase